MAECSRHVLVVDDDRTACMMVASYLRQAGWTVTTAHTPEAALSAADGTRLSLILTDLQLEAKIDGVDIFRSIRDRQPFLRGILLSAYVDYAAILRVIESGFDDCLMKPAERSEIVRAADSSCSTFTRWSNRIADLRQIRR